MAFARTKSVVRRFPRSFSLRVLLVLMTVCCLWIGWRANRAHQQRQAVALLQKAGLVVEYDHEIHPANLQSLRRPLASPRLRSWFGVDFLHDVLRVSGPHRKLGAAEVRALTHLPALISLGAADVPGSAVNRFGELTTLRFLSVPTVDGQPIRDVAFLARLKNLEALYLSGTHIDDAGLAHLRGLTQLRDLTLSQTKITDAGLANLCRLNLERLTLADTNTTEVGLRHIASMTKLQRLDLRNTRVAHLDFAAELTNLQRLELRHMRVGGHSTSEFRCLRAITGLATLDLRDVDVTDADLAALAPLAGLKELLLSAATIKTAPERNKSVSDLEFPTMRRPKYLLISREEPVGKVYSTMGRLSAESVELLQQPLPRCRIRCFETSR